MIRDNHQYFLSSGDLAWSSPYLYFQITRHIDLRIYILTYNLILDTNTSNRLNANDTKMMYDSDK
jgi:hypothetical protein